MKTKIKVQLALHEQTQKDLAIFLGLSEVWISHKMNHPETWTIGELMKMAKKWKINIRELLP